MRKKNINIVLQSLSFFSWKQRKEIVNETGLPRSTVYDSLLKIEIAGILETKQQSHGKGRPRTYFRLVA